MLLKIFGWYSLIFLSLSIIVNVAGEGEETIKITKTHGVVRFLMQLPIAWFIYKSLCG